MVLQWRFPDQVKHPKSATFWVKRQLFHSPQRIHSPCTLTAAFHATFLTIAWVQASCPYHTLTDLLTSCTEIGNAGVKRLVRQNLQNSSYSTLCLLELIPPRAESRTFCCSWPIQCITYIGIAVEDLSCEHLYHWKHRIFKAQLFHARSINVSMRWQQITHLCSRKPAYTRINNDLSRWLA